MDNISDRPIYEYLCCKAAPHETPLEQSLRRELKFAERLIAEKDKRIEIGHRTVAMLKSIVYSFVALCTLLFGILVYYMTLDVQNPQVGILTTQSRLASILGICSIVLIVITLILIIWILIKNIRIRNDNNDLF